MSIGKRQSNHAERARAIVKDLLDSLGATTSYAQREPRRRVKLPWRALYGWQLAFTAKKGSVLDADGKPTQIELVKKFTAEPGDIVTSRASVRTGAPARRYMVRADRSLRAI
jgi:hypothetical protein